MAKVAEKKDVDNLTRLQSLIQAKSFEFQILQDRWAKEWADVCKKYDVDTASSINPQTFEFSEPPKKAEEPKAPDETINPS